MNYTILANKWRPKSFQEVIGQKYIIQAISNSFYLNKIHQAWILSGTRGIGKTTIARLLAKRLNCINPNNLNSCNICLNCQEIDKKSFPDILEIDAASKTKVEDIRELLDNIQYVPIQGKYKVYLVDEVHMLSKHSFNALLKVLEEPPKYIKFILMTTEINKLPDTILSRCMYFNLKPINIQNIQKHLINILTKEKIIFEIKALQIISTYAKGSIRDALNLIEQAILIDNQNITLLNILNMFNIINREQVLELVIIILEKNVNKLMNKLNIIYNNNIDLEQILTEILKIFYNIFIFKNINNIIYNIKSQYKKKIFQISQLITYQNIQNYYKIILIGKKELYLAPNIKIGIEITLLNFLHAVKNKIKIYSE